MATMEGHYQHGLPGKPTGQKITDISDVVGQAGQWWHGLPGRPTHWKIVEK